MSWSKRPLGSAIQKLSGWGQQAIKVVVCAVSPLRLDRRSAQPPLRRSHQPLELDEMIETASIITTLAQCNQAGTIDY